METNNLLTAEQARELSPNKEVMEDLMKRIKEEAEKGKCEIKLNKQPLKKNVIEELKSLGYRVYLNKGHYGHVISWYD